MLIASLGCAERHGRSVDAAAAPADAGSDCGLASAFSDWRLPSPEEVRGSVARTHEDRLHGMFGVFSSGETVAYRGAVTVTDDYELLGEDFTSPHALAWLFRSTGDFRGEITRLVIMSEAGDQRVNVDVVRAEPATVYVTPAVPCASSLTAGGTCTDCPLDLDSFPERLTFALEASGDFGRPAPPFTVNVEADLTRVPPDQLTAPDLLQLWACRESHGPPPASDFELVGGDWVARDSERYSDAVPVPEGCGYYGYCDVAIDYTFEYYLSDADPSSFGLRAIEVLPASRSSLCCTRYWVPVDAVYTDTDCPFAEGS